MTTLYTRVVELSLLYEVWEIFLFERDKLMIFYFAVGLMITKRDHILSLGNIEKLLKYLPNIRIDGYQDLSNVYSNTILVRRNMPVSFQILINRLGIFDYKPIISKEELNLIENICLIDWMPIACKEVLMGSSMTLENMNDDNNNKYKNLLVLQEDEQ